MIKLPYDGGFQLALGGFSELCQLSHRLLPPWDLLGQVQVVEQAYDLCSTCNDG